MARQPSLKPQLNQIRTWVAEGVTDIWIAHQLDRTPVEVADFRRKHGLTRPGEPVAPAKAPRAAKPKAAKPAADKPKAAAKPKAAKKPAETAAEPVADDGDEAAPAKRRRRGRRGGRGRSRGRTAVAAVLEHGEDGVVIRVDAAVLQSTDYREHWAGVTTASVTVTATGIAIAAGDAADEADAGDDADTADDAGA